MYPSVRSSSPWHWVHHNRSLWHLTLPQYNWDLWIISRMSVAEMLCSVHCLSRKSKKVLVFKLPVALSKSPVTICVTHRKAQQLIPPSWTRQEKHGLLLAVPKKRGQRLLIFELVWFTWTEVMPQSFYVTLGPVKKAVSHTVKCSENTHPRSPQCCRNKTILCMWLYFKTPFFLRTLFILLRTVKGTSRETGIL